MGGLRGDLQSLSRSIILGSRYCLHPASSERQGLEGRSRHSKLCNPILGAPAQAADGLGRRANQEKGKTVSARQRRSRGNAVPADAAPVGAQALADGSRGSLRIVPPNIQITKNSNRHCPGKGPTGHPRVDPPGEPHSWAALRALAPTPGQAYENCCMKLRPGR